MVKQLDLFGFDEQVLKSVNGEAKSPYSSKTGALIYKPTERMPFLGELCDDLKYKRLLRQIDASSVSEQEKSFLRLAASRHIVFHYAKIADYYANASADMQRLMENSALVIIDFDRAIELGYVKLSENIRKIQLLSGEWAKSNETSDG